MFNYKIFKILKLIIFNIKELIIFNNILKNIIINLLLKKNIRIKIGFDPTSPNIHLGHMILLNKIKQLQIIKYIIIIIIIGDFTSLIGDPDDIILRPLLNKNKIKNNSINYFNQMIKIININNIEIYYNSKWYNKLSIKNLLQILSIIPLSRIIERENFSNRILNKLSIYINELIYPILQGYDSIITNSDIEIGGIDQKYNLLIARKIQKIFNIKLQNIMTMPLLTDNNYIKMSKSKNNNISFNENPEIIFNKIMFINDIQIWDYYRLILCYSKNKILYLKKKIFFLKNIILYKIILSKKILLKLFSNKISNIIINFYIKKKIKNKPINIKTFFLKWNFLLNLKKILISLKIYSNSILKNLIIKNNIYINKNITKNLFYKFKIGNFKIKIGKKQFFNIKII